MCIRDRISRAKSSDYQKKAKDRQKKLATQLQKKEDFEGLVYLEALCEQIESDNPNETTYFFYDETELVLTQEQAGVIIDKFNQLSEDHKEKLMDMLPDSKDILSTFLNM